MNEFFFFDLLRVGRIGEIDLIERANKEGFVIEVILEIFENRWLKKRSAQKFFWLKAF